MLGHTAGLAEDTRSYHGWLETRMSMYQLISAGGTRGHVRR